MHRYWLLCMISLLLLFPVAAYAQKGHAKDVLTEVPMPEIFLQPVKYVAHTGTTTLYLRRVPDVSCAGLEPCMEIPYKTEIEDAEWFEKELFTLTIPEKTLKDVFSAVPRFGPNFNLRNFDGVQHDALFQARLIVTLESPALPEGAVRTAFGDRRVVISLEPDSMFGDTIHYTRHGIVGREWLRNNVGLTETQVDEFFDNEITVRVSVMVRGALLAGGSIYVGVLIQGY